MKLLHSLKNWIARPQPKPACCCGTRSQVVTIAKDAKHTCCGGTSVRKEEQNAAR